MANTLPNPQASLAARVVNLQRKSAGLRESLPVPLQRHLADRLEASSLAPFQEQARRVLKRNKRRGYGGIGYHRLAAVFSATVCRGRPQLCLTAPLMFALDLAPLTCYYALIWYALRICVFTYLLVLGRPPGSSSLIAGSRLAPAAVSLLMFLFQNLPAKPRPCVCACGTVRLCCVSLPIAGFQKDMAFVTCYQGGVAIRTAPSVDAPCVGEVLQWNEASKQQTKLSWEWGADYSSRPDHHSNYHLLHGLHVYVIFKTGCCY